jgi:hypothetical protein
MRDLTELHSQTVSGGCDTGPEASWRWIFPHPCPKPWPPRPLPTPPEPKPLPFEKFGDYLTDYAFGLGVKPCAITFVD